LAKAAPSFADFRAQIQQRHLTDLSSQLYRFGRAFRMYSSESERVDAESIRENRSYMEDIKVSTPRTWAAITAPGDTVRIYRAVPTAHAREGIRVGDYVALDPSYARMHGLSVLRGQQKESFRTISKVVPKSDVIWGEADWNEWAYSPASLRQRVPSLEEFYAQAHADQLPGGIGDETTDEDVNERELAEGQKHEMEHTNDGALAREIARDHLTEDPEYYTHLKQVEGAAMYSYATPVEAAAHGYAVGALVSPDGTWREAKGAHADVAQQVILEREGYTMRPFEALQHLLGDGWIRVTYPDAVEAYNGSEDRMLSVGANLWKCLPVL
jgi:hypothetical protein